MLQQYLSIADNHNFFVIASCPIQIYIYWKDFYVKRYGENIDFRLGYESNWMNLNIIFNQKKNRSPRKERVRKLWYRKVKLLFKSFMLQRFWSSTHKLSANIGYPLFRGAPVLYQQNTTQNVYNKLSDKNFKLTQESGSYLETKLRLKSTLIGNA